MSNKSYEEIISSVITNNSTMKEESNALIDDSNDERDGERQNEFHEKERAMIAHKTPSSVKNTCLEKLM